jgi:hypothetical protein
VGEWIGCTRSNPLRHAVLLPLAADSCREGAHASSSRHLQHLRGHPAGQAPCSRLHVPPPPPATHHSVQATVT